MSEKHKYIYHILSFFFFVFLRQFFFEKNKKDEGEEEQENDELLLTITDCMYVCVTYNKLFSAFVSSFYRFFFSSIRQKKTEEVFFSFSSFLMFQLLL